VDWRTHAFCVKERALRAKRISIIIRPAAVVEMLVALLESLTRKTTYPIMMVVIIQDDSQSVEAARVFRACSIAVAFLRDSQSPALRTLRSKQTEKTQWLLFLDGEIEVIESDGCSHGRATSAPEAV